MPIIVFGNSSSSYDKGNKTDTSLFVQNLIWELIIQKLILKKILT